MLICSGADGPVAGGFVVGVRGGGAVALDEVEGAVTIGPGEMFVAAKGVEHKPFAAGEVRLMLIEPRGVVNTGDAGGERTAKNDVWV